MKNRVYVCRFNRWHHRGVGCECGRKAVAHADRKTIGWGWLRA